MFLEPLQTQYVLVNGTATFHCRTHGAVMDVFWVVNGTAITISHPNEMKRYESLGFSFIDSSGNNLTINVSAASESTNSTRIFCSIINSNFNMIMSNTAYLYVFTDLRKLTLHVHRYLRLISYSCRQCPPPFLYNIVFNIRWWIINSLITKYVYSVISITSLQVHTHQKLLQLKWGAIASHHWCCMALYKYSLDGRDMTSRVLW